MGKSGSTMSEGQKEFKGQATNRLDDKERVFIPKAFSEAMLHLWGPEPSLTLFAHGVGKCLCLAKKSVWAEANRGVEKLGLNDPLAIRLRRLNALTTDVRPDKLGRIPVPKFLRDAAGLRDEVRFVGCRDYLELWDPANFDKETEDLFAGAGERVASEARSRPEFSGGGTGGASPSGGGV